MSKIIRHAIVQDKKTGHKYFSEKMEVDQPFTTLYDPYIYASKGVDIRVFDSETGQVRLKFYLREFYESVNDLMLPSNSLVINLLPKGEKLKWAETTEQEVDDDIAQKVEIAETEFKKHQDDYYLKLPLLKKILFLIFEKR